MDSTQRFSNRVDYYVKYRPSYPQAAIDFIYAEFGLAGDPIIADVGSGTGILTKLLLERGSTVYGVEPNLEMREAAEIGLKNYETFHSYFGTAENTTLPDRSVDLIVSAQAFHWFQRELARSEFRRIIRPGGKVVIIWNQPVTQEFSFSSEYEKLGDKFGKEYEKINHRNFTQADFIDFFNDGICHAITFDNEQLLDYEGLIGRLLSSSYMPLPNDEGYEPLLESINELYAKYNHNGNVSIQYKTELYYGEV